jgi:CMP-N-acetylneuraminic acid synthetase
MRVVIPAKSTSTRCKNKNWRQFYHDHSLVDVLLHKLLACDFAPSDIYISSDSHEMLQEMVDVYDVNVLMRPAYFTELETPTDHFIAELMSHFDAEEDVALAHCTTPTFDEHQQVIDRWAMGDLTSIAVAQQAPAHLLLECHRDMQPIGWSFGKHFAKSQDVMTMYQMTFSFQIMKGKHWQDFNFYTAPRCHWHIAQGTHIDINTEQDFADAQAVYASRF